MRPCRRVKIFDLDNSGAIGFREFIYGLSKFQVHTLRRPSIRNPKPLAP
jgi:hypothetical protein